MDTFHPLHKTWSGDRFLSHELLRKKMTGDEYRNTCRHECMHGCMHCISVHMHVYSHICIHTSPTQANKHTLRSHSSSHTHARMRYTLPPPLTHPPPLAHTRTHAPPPSLSGPRTHTLPSAPPPTHFLPGPHTYTQPPALSLPGPHTYTHTTQGGKDEDDKARSSPFETQSKE